MNLGPYAAFILAAYMSALGIVAALVAWIMLDQRNLTRVMDEMEKRGMGRRAWRGEKNWRGEKKP
jgi:heme exporter protein D